MVVAAIWLGCACAEEPVRLAVVRTWGELRAQPAIVPRDGGTVRLGIESATCAKGSGILIYGLLNDCTDCESGVPGRLGPFSVEREGDTAQAAITCCFAQKVDGLSVATLTIADRDHLSVRLVDGDRVVATASIQADPRSAESWNALFTGEEDRGWHVGPGCMHPAVPAWVGPYAIVDTADAPLPTFIPTTVDPGLRLRRDGDAIVLESDSNLVSTRPDPFLVRLWLNGNLVESRSEPPICVDWVCPRYAPVRSEHFRLDPEWTEVHRGDTVGFQVLFCPDGWEDPRQAELMDVIARDVPPRLSERIDFTVE
jgi:hypothetical protein